MIEIVFLNSGKHIVFVKDQICPGLHGIFIKLNTAHMSRSEIDSPKIASTPRMVIIIFERNSWEVKIFTYNISYLRQYPPEITKELFKGHSSVSRRRKSIANVLRGSVFKFVTLSQKQNFPYPGSSNPQNVEEVYQNCKKVAVWYYIYKEKLGAFIFACWNCCQRSPQGCSGIQRMYSYASISQILNIRPGWSFIAYFSCRKSVIEQKTRKLVD